MQERQKSVDSVQSLVGALNRSWQQASPQTPRCPRADRNLTRITSGRGCVKSLRICLQVYLAHKAPTLKTLQGYLVYKETYTKETERI